MNPDIQHLYNCPLAMPQASYPVHSRIHPLRSFHFPSAKCYIKRDDELGFGISGSKIRKYRSLVPFLLERNIQEVIVIGSAYSNHVLSFIQLLIENGIQPTLFLRGNTDCSLQGNALLTSLFIPSSSIHWISQLDWKQVEALAHAYAEKQPHPTVVLPEGGGCAAALPGALTLPLDLLDNEQKQNVQFDHIFIEAGTGFTASALILGLNWLEHPAHIHVLLLAEDEEAFLMRLTRCHEMFIQLMGISSPLPSHFTCHSPLLTKGFGQTNLSSFETIKQLARDEGLLTDPIYSAKLCMESKRLIAQRTMTGNILIHHSGGSLTLMGFQHQLQKILKKSDAF